MLFSDSYQAVEKIMKKITLGIVAHVDSGKTTLSEAILYRTGVIRSFGRVDKGESFLDNDSLERKRGITIYSKQAGFSYGDTKVNLLDTPGHADLSAEMERTLQVLDYALLIISAGDGITGQGENLWRLLEKYDIPVFIFFNKMDMPDSSRERLLDEARRRLSDRITDFGAERTDDFYDHAAMGDEDSMEEYLSEGKLSDDTIRDLIADRKVFPAFFGSALKDEGVEELLKAIDELTLERDYPAEFGARVFKIFRDDAGRRLKMMKITGGSLKARSTLPDGDSCAKINQIRIYSGDRFETVQEVNAGDVCAVEGLNESHAGQGFGYESGTVLPVLMPVMRYRVVIGGDKDPVMICRQFRMVEEENPELYVDWDEETKEIYVRVMGQVQLEVLAEVMKRRFSLDVTFDTGEVIYRETIDAPVIGAGHFEPLRHYAEVILLMEPLEPGSGLEFASDVDTDLLALNWQRLILTHLAEKEHRGVLTGSVITDMRITVIGGRADKKHTEGGDFRKATYRAVRQGLMMAENVLLEPYFSFQLRVPEANVGRAMTDLDRMNAVFSAPENSSGYALISGRVPVREAAGYPMELAAYTKGLGSMTMVPDGYGRCRDSASVIASKGYDPLADTANTPDSVFCAHGSGYIVPYDRVYEYIHTDLDSLRIGKKDIEDVMSGAEVPITDTRRTRSPGYSLGTEEIDSIVSGTTGRNAAAVHKWKSKRRKTFGLQDGGAVSSAMHGKGGKTFVSSVFQPEDADYLLVDGYNVIFAWDDLNDLAQANIDSARISLLEKLCNWQAVTGSEVIAVFDAYRVKGHDTEVLDYLNIHVVFTKEAETADQYIEKFAHEKGKKHKVAVVTSDGLEQIIIRGQGCALVSSREFKNRMDAI